jgi:triacylglycerol lipase
MDIWVRRCKMGRILCGLLAALSSLVLVPAALAGDTGPPLSVPTDKLAGALKCPTEFTHPQNEPVLVLQGFGLTAEESFSGNYLRALPADDFDVCTITRDEYMLADMQESAEYVAYAVRKISGDAKHKKVDILGYSEGAAYSRWAIKWWPDVRSKVDDLVTIAGGNHGISGGNAICASGACVPAAWQLRIGSSFMAALNAPDETPGEVDVTSIYTASDQGVPPTAARIEGATNVLIQDECPDRQVTHGKAIFDDVAYKVATDAFAHPHPANLNRVRPKLDCSQEFLPGATAADYDFLAGTLQAQWQLRIVGLPPLSFPRITAEPALKPYAQQ